MQKMWHCSGQQLRLLLLAWLVTCTCSCGPADDPCKYAGVPLIKVQTGLLVAAVLTATPYHGPGLETFKMG